MGKTKGYIISVNEPCKQSWDTMAPQGCGRFCNSCQKTVIDLTNLTNKGLFEILEKYPASFCGRINKDKEGKVLFAGRTRPAGNAHLFKMIAGLFTTASLLISLRSVAQVPQKKTVATQQYTDPGKILISSAAKDRKYKVFGNIIDTSNGQLGIAGKIVRVNADNELFAITDRWGYYEIEIPQRYKGQIFGIAVDCSDEYFGEPVPVRFGELPFRYNFYRGTIPEQSFLLGSVAIVSVKKESWWRRIFKSRR